MRNTSTFNVKRAALLLALTLTAGLCRAQEKPKATEKPPIADKLSDHTATLPPPHGKNSSPKGIQFWTPTPDDIARLETDLPKLAKEKVIPKQQGNPTPESILTYYRQYSGIIQEGKRVIYVRAFHPSKAPQFPYWRTRPIAVADGGYGFYYVRYDVKSRQFGSFYFGGR